MSDLKSHDTDSAFWVEVLIESKMEPPHHHFFSKSLDVVGFP